MCYQPSSNHSSAKHLTPNRAKQAGERVCAVYSAAAARWCSFLLIAQANWWPTFVVGFRMVVRLAITPQASSLGARGSHGSRV